MTAATRIAYGSHQEQVADLRVPAGAGPHPVLIMLHGGGFAAGPNLERLSPVCEDLTSAGIATWNVEYRRLEGTGGGWPQTWQDAGAAADFLAGLAEEHRLDLNRVAAFGHSAGAALSLWLAGRHRVPPFGVLSGDARVKVRAAIAAAGVCDLARDWPERLRATFNELMGGTPAEQPVRYAASSPIQLLPMRVPQLLIHGTADTTVPVGYSEEYVDAAKWSGDDARLVTIEGAEHPDIRDAASPHWPAVRAEIISFLGESLK